MVTILLNPYAVCWFLILCVFILQITALKHSGRVGTRIVTKPKPSRSQPTRAIPPAWSMHILTTLGTWGWAKFLIRDLLQDFGISSVNQFSWNIPVSTPEGLIHKWIFCKYISFILLSFLYARLKNGRIMLWQCPSVRPSEFSGLFFNVLWDINLKLGICIQ